MVRFSNQTRYVNDQKDKASRCQRRECEHHRPHRFVLKRKVVILHDQVPILVPLHGTNYLLFPRLRLRGVAVAFFGEVVSEEGSARGGGGIASFVKRGNNSSRVASS
jgi:hypothetical protein